MNIQETLIDKLGRSMGLVELFYNTKKESKLTNRIQKFLRRPYKYLYQNLSKLGVVPYAVRTRTFWGEKMTIPLSDRNAVILYFTGTLGSAEMLVSKFLIRNLGPHEVFYDVGANYGFYSKLGGFLGAEVHSFEPNPHCLTYTRMNATKTQVNPVALSDSAGSISFFDMSVDNKSGMSTIQAEVAAQTHLKYMETKVQSTTLDSYVATHHVPTIMKIDVEGAEERVLKGATALLSRHAPVIVMEVLDSPAAIEHSKNAIGVLRDLGYMPHEILPSGETRPATINVGNLGQLNNFVFKKGEPK